MRCSANGAPESLPCQALGKSQAMPFSPLRLGGGFVVAQPAPVPTTKPQIMPYNGREPRGVAQPGAPRPWVAREVAVSHRTRNVMLVISTAVVVGIFAMAVAPTIGQAPPGFRAPRTKDGHPDLNGIWQAFNTANWDLQSHGVRPALAVRPGRVAGTIVPAAPVIALGAVGAVPAGFGVVEGDEIPYRPEALAKKKENQQNWLTRDPEVKCFMPGVPRATYMPFPFQIVQGTDKITIVYAFAGATRTIEVGGKDEAPIDSWMGWSNARWEGETLVVDVTGLNDQTWFDRAGNFHSEAMHVVERYTATSPYHLRYEATIEDPKVFTRPWKISMPLYRSVEPNAEMLEFKCVEFVEELMFGKLRKEPLPMVDDFRQWYNGFVAFPQLPVGQK